MTHCHCVLQHRVNSLQSFLESPICAKAHVSRLYFHISVYVLQLGQSWPLQLINIIIFHKINAVSVLLIHCINTKAKHKFALCLHATVFLELQYTTVFLLREEGLFWHDFKLPQYVLLFTWWNVNTYRATRQKINTPVSKIFVSLAKQRCWCKIFNTCKPNT